MARNSRYRRSVKTEGRLTQEEDTIMKLSGKVYNGFVKVFGDIKVFKFPLFAVYDPGGYKVKGEDIREVIQKLRPGDILIRGYENYLDGYFIPGFFYQVMLLVRANEQGGGKADKTILFGIFTRF